MSTLSFSLKPRPQTPAAARAGFPLAEVGAIDIQPDALEHRHILEARAITELKNDGRIESVIGTTNNPGEPCVQLYGWGRHVYSHADHTGWIYFCPLVVRRSLVCALPANTDIKRRVRVYLRRGRVYRLNDYVTHWTQDSAPVVALYCGVFDLPDDERAVTMLQSGAQALATGADDAPRVKPGFQRPFEDECFTEECGDRVVKIADARRLGMLIATCHCGRRAVIVDTQCPHDWRFNACEAHLETAEATS